MVCNPSSITPPSPVCWRDRTLTAWISSCCCTWWLFPWEGKQRREKEGELVLLSYSVCRAKWRWCCTPRPRQYRKNLTCFPPTAVGWLPGSRPAVGGKLFPQITRWAARGGGGDEIKMPAYLRVGVEGRGIYVACARSDGGMGTKTTSRKPQDGCRSGGCKQPA